MMISRARLNPKGHILTSEGTFIQYTTHALIEDNEVVSVPLKEGKFDPESFKDKMNDETSIILTVTRIIRQVLMLLKQN